MDICQRHGKLIAVVVLGTMLAVVTIHYALKYSKKNAFCDPAPYIYATFHDEASNIYKYSRNGCLLSKEVLVGGPEYALSSHLIELRSMVFGKYNGSDALYVADAYSDDSYMNVYGQCNADGSRDYLTTAVSTVTDPGVNHLYGICFDKAGNVYGSSQHTDNVLRFTKDTFEPMKPPSEMVRSLSHNYEYYPGTFIQFGQPTIHEREQQGVRDIIAVEDDIWIANEDVNGIYIVDQITGRVKDIVDIPMPIGLHYSAHNGLVFVSSKGLKYQGSVYSISVKTKEIVHKYKSKKMTHPTGLTTHDTTLFVANQKRGQIVSFNIKSGRFLKYIVEDMPTGIEQILISPC